MKYYLAIFVCALGSAQSTTTTYVTDLNGRKVEADSVASSDHTKTERTRSINGREVPLEQIQTKLIRQDSGGKVTETIIRKFDPSGQLASTERVLTEETNSASGSTVRLTTYRSDLNGSMHQVERKTVETRVQGPTTSTDIMIDRPSLNGAFETAEKRTAVTQTSDAGSRTDETVYRRSPEGRLYEALRQTSAETVAGNQVNANAAYYELDADGRMRLASQRVTTTTKKPDGSEVSEVNLYAPSVPGRVPDAQAPQQIKEQQIIERQKGPGGTIIETLSVRRPTITDPNRLGSLQKISETVCRGECTQPAKP